MTTDLRAQFKTFLLRFSIKDQILFVKRLSFLTGAGVPLLESLKMLKIQQGKSLRKAPIFDKLIEDVASGQFLSSSLKSFPRAFGPLSVSMIRVGEVGGVLEENLKFLAEELRKRWTLRRKFLGALLYPGIIAVTTLGIVGFIMTYIFPKIVPIFQSLNVALPLTTRILLAVSQFLISYGLYTIAGLVGLFIFGWFVTRQRVIKLVFHRLILVIPILGKLYQSYTMTNLCRTLGVLLRSDSKILDAFRIAYESTENLIYQREIETVGRKVAKGEKISTHLAGVPHLFPEMVAQMVAIGERTGKLGDSFLYLADLYEAEVDELTKNLSTVIEPLLMIIMGIIVGLVAFSVITPIYEFTRSLSHH